MDANGAPTLSDRTGPRLVLSCAKCDRRGVYAVAPLGSAWRGFHLASEAR